MVEKKFTSISKCDEAIYAMLNGKIGGRPANDPYNANERWQNWLDMVEILEGAAVAPESPPYARQPKSNVSRAPLPRSINVLLLGRPGNTITIPGSRATPLMLSQSAHLQG
jgi:hypothetical protein